jgi:rhodanese-related sulfurtransferase
MSPQIEDVQVTELSHFVAEHPGSVLLDVREPWEVELASIAPQGARVVAIPMNEIPRQLDTLRGDHAIVCMCHHGMRSAHVARYLIQAGFSNVVNLSGGIDAWSIRVDEQVPRY